MWAKGTESCLLAPCTLWTSHAYVLLHAKKREKCSWRSLCACLCIGMVWELLSQKCGWTCRHGYVGTAGMIPLLGMVPPALNDYTGFTGICGLMSGQLASTSVIRPQWEKSSRHLWKGCLLYVSLVHNHLSPQTHLLVYIMVCRNVTVQACLWQLRYYSDLFKASSCENCHVWGNKSPLSLKKTQRAKT